MKKIGNKQWGFYMNPMLITYYFVYYLENYFTMIRK